MMAEGKIKFKIDYVNGFDECPNALIRLLTGQNNGKVIVKVYPEQLKAKL